MNYAFDYVYMRNEMIDFALAIKNEELFQKLTSPNYEDYIAQFLGFDNQQAFESVLKETSTVKLFVDWIEENKYEKHKLVIRYLIEHPSHIDIHDGHSIEKWDVVSKTLHNNLPNSWLFDKMRRLFNEDIAIQFLEYIGSYKQN